MLAVAEPEAFAAAVRDTAASMASGYVAASRPAGWHRHSDRPEDVAKASRAIGRAEAAYMAWRDEDLARRSREAEEREARERAEAFARTDAALADGDDAVLATLAR